MDGISRHHQVVIEKLSGILAVGVDSTDLGCRKDHDFRRLFGREELIHRRLVTQVQFAASFQNQIVDSRRTESADQCPAYHASVAGHVNSTFLERFGHCDFELATSVHADARN